MTHKTIGETSNNENNAEDANNEVFTAAAPAQQNVLLALPSEIYDIFHFLSLNEKIVFKSQQIDDPELEKMQIAQELYTKNRQTFLERFGSYFEEQHLQAYARFVIEDPQAIPARVDENFEEIIYMLRKFQERLQTRQKDVKNRRYIAMLHLEQEGEYFSEREMMKRAPELYQELVGQYLSEAEKKQRDSYDVKNTTFSGILMHQLEHQQLQDVLKRAITCDEGIINNDREAERAMKCEYAGSDSEIPVAEELSKQEFAESVEDIVPLTFRWGNFDSEPRAIESQPANHNAPKEATNAINAVTSKTSVATKRQPPKDCFIAAGERELLRQEFVDILHEQFLAGHDKDFDYTQVDDNTQLDDLKQLNQDREDAYFQESDDENENKMVRDQSEDESEDELDVFMNHLSKHHTLQNT